MHNVFRHTPGHLQTVQFLLFIRLSWQARSRLKTRSSIMMQIWLCSNYGDCVSLLMCPGHQCPPWYDSDHDVVWLWSWRGMTMIMTWLCGMTMTSGLLWLWLWLWSWRGMTMIMTWLSGMTMTMTIWYDYDYDYDYDYVVVWLCGGMTMIMTWYDYDNVVPLCRLAWTMTYNWPWGPWPGIWGTNPKT